MESWTPFSGKLDVPIFTSGCVAVFYKIFTPSLFSLWLFPALVSILTLGVAYASARLFPGPAAFILFFLACLSFGPVYTGRFCESPVLNLFWTTSTLGLMGLRLQKTGSRRERALDWVLGIVTGLGFFISTGWLSVVLAVVLALEGRRQSLRIGKGQLKWGFWVPLMFLLGIFLLFCYREGYGNHIRNLLPFQTGWSLSQQFIDSFSNVTTLFWGAPTITNYGPIWGGILNPLLAACFFLGILECWRLRQQPVVQWTVASLFLFLAPGLVSKGFEFFRIYPVLIPLFLLCVLGLLSLLKVLHSPFSRLLALGIILTASTLLDSYHLLGPYRQTWGNPEWPYWPYLKTSSSWKAFTILQKKADEVGPGVVLSDFQPNVMEQTLSVAVYPFDAARNPGIPLERVRWAALIVNADEKLFIARDFPSIQWFWLGMDPVTCQYMALAVIPWDIPSSKKLQVWTDDDRCLFPVTSQILKAHAGDSEEIVIHLLLQARQSMKKERFVECSLWEKLAYHKRLEKNPGGALEAVELALKAGYPTAHLFYLKGVLLNQLGRTAEARRAFQEAAKSPMNFTPALETLNALPRNLD